MLVTPFVGLAGFGLALRVAQHGLTPARVAGLAVTVVVALYAAGYAWAALRARPWMKPLETVNLAAAGVAVLVMLAMLTPAADPARLSVDDQLARLRTGLTSPAVFDFDALQFRSARFGRAATASLARSLDPAVAAAAQAAQRREYAGETVATSGGRPFARARLHSTGAALPADFRDYDWRSSSQVTTQWDAAACLISATPCDLYVIDLDHDGSPEVVALAPDVASPSVFHRAPDGHWMRAGGYEGAYDPPGVRQAIASGDVHPSPQALPDLQVGPQLYRYTPSRDYLNAIKTGRR